MRTIFVGNGHAFCEVDSMKNETWHKKKSLRTLKKSGMFAPTTETTVVLITKTMLKHIFAQPKHGIRYDS